MAVRLAVQLPLLGWVYLLTLPRPGAGEDVQAVRTAQLREAVHPHATNAIYCSDACRNAEHQACHRERNPEAVRSPKV